MGMFDYVRVGAMPCRKCGKDISSWQSKDTACYMDTVEVDRVRNFYATCPGCGAWNEYVRRSSEQHLDDPQKYVRDHYVYCGDDPVSEQGTQR